MTHTPLTRFFTPVMAALKEIGIEMTPDNMSKLMSGDRSALESQHGKGNDGKDK